MLTSDVRYFFRTAKEDSWRGYKSHLRYGSRSREPPQNYPRAHPTNLWIISPRRMCVSIENCSVLSSWNEGKTGLRWWSMTSSPWDVGKERKVARARPTFDQETNDCSHHDFVLEILRALTVNDLLPSLYAYFFLQIHTTYYTHYILRYIYILHGKSALFASLKKLWQILRQD